MRGLPLRRVWAAGAWLLPADDAARRVLSSVALLLQGKEAFYFSKTILYTLLPDRLKGKKYAPPQFVQYLLKSSYFLILTAMAAGVDVLLSMCFSGIFHFT